MSSAHVDFDDFAGNYDAALGEALSVTGEDKNYFARRRVEITRAVVERAGVNPWRVLDFGCGTGSATPFLVERLGARELVGVDPSERSLRVAAANWGRHPARFVTPSALETEAAFDLAICNGVFHHIPPAERAEALHRIRRALRPGGLFAFWENNPWNPGTRLVMSRCAFDRDAQTIPPHAAARLLAAAGLEPVHRSSHFYFPKPLAFLRGLEPLLSQLPLGGQYLILASRRSGVPAAK